MRETKLNKFKEVTSMAQLEPFKLWLKLDIFDLNHRRPTFNFEHPTFGFLHFAFCFSLSTFHPRLSAF